MAKGTNNALYQDSEPRRLSGWAILCFIAGMIGLPFTWATMEPMYKWVFSPFGRDVAASCFTVWLITPFVITAIAGAIALRQVLRRVAPRRGMEMIIGGFGFAGGWAVINAI